MSKSYLNKFFLVLVLIVTQRSGFSLHGKSYNERSENVMEYTKCIFWVISYFPVTEKVK